MGCTREKISIFSGESRLGLKIKLGIRVKRHIGKFHFGGSTILATFRFSLVGLQTQTLISID